MKKISTIVIKAELKNLCFIRNLVSRDTEPFFSSEKDIFEIVISTDEVCSNIIRHAYQGKPGQTFKLSTSINNNAFLVSFEHYGKGYDPRLHHMPMPLYLRKASGGFGIDIIKKTIDHIEYYQLTDSVHIILIKIIK